MIRTEIPAYFEPVLTAKQRFIVIIGGRNSAKSRTVAHHMIQKNVTENADILCGREYQKSIEDSVHKLLKEMITEYGIPGYTITDRKIDYITGKGFRFRGFAHDPEGAKSAEGFKYSWIEEAQSLSQEAIDTLIPTIRQEGAQQFFTANPGSSEDPFSKKFINPFLPILQRDGIYVDDMHMIIVANWRDNPWHSKEMEQLRLLDRANMSRAKYDHIWEGAFNDTVENSLIVAEWFDACIDAHKKLGFQATGIRFSAHDPSDVGEDLKGFAFRHGSVVQWVDEMTTGRIDEGCDWATGMAIKHGSEFFTWDCDGMGVGLNAQVNLAFRDTFVNVCQFKGSEGVDFPDAICNQADQANQEKGAAVFGQKTNKQALKNIRAQYYLELRNRMITTYKAVEQGVYSDPDKMISFDSSIPCLTKLRAELCRMPVKPNGNGLFELYPKPEMKSKFKVASPNLADSVMMLMRPPKTNMLARQHVMPRPVQHIGAGHAGFRRH